VVNGLVATAVHFSVLTFNLQVMKIPSAGVANFLAAVVGITVSFLGSRYFVFRAKERSLVGQAWKFIVLYGTLALLQGGVLFLWTDWLKYDYRLGFLLATGLQMVVSYFGNKRLVFVK